MDLLDLLKLIARRWYVTAPIVVLTLAAAVAIGVSIKPEYKGSSAVVLVPPTTQPAKTPNGNPTPGNPWLEVGVNAMAQAIQIAVSAHDARSQVGAAGGQPGYQVALVTRSSILTVDVTAADRQTALTTIRAVNKLIADEVTRQQAGYKPKPGEQITTEVLDPGLNITQSTSKALRVQIVAAVIGLLLAAAAGAIFDAVVRRRAERRLAARHAGRRSPGGSAGQATVGPRQSGPAGQVAIGPAQSGPVNQAAVEARQPPPLPAGPLPAAPPPVEATQPLAVRRPVAPIAPAARTGNRPQPPGTLGRAPDGGQRALFTAARRAGEDQGS